MSNQDTGKEGALIFETFKLFSLNLSLKITIFQLLRTTGLLTAISREHTKQILEEKLKY